MTSKLSNALRHCEGGMWLMHSDVYVWKNGVVKRLRCPSFCRLEAPDRRNAQPGSQLRGGIAPSARARAGAGWFTDQVPLTLLPETTAARFQSHEKHSYWHAQ